MRVLLVLSMFLSLAGVSNAATIISVTGPDEGDGALIATDGTAPNPGVGVSFTLDSAVENARFEFDFYCGNLVESCGGSLSLTNTGLGPTSTDLSSVETFLVGPDTTSTLTAFDGFDLAAGTWSVLLTLDRNVAQWGVWLGSNSPTVSGDGRGTPGGAQLIDNPEWDFPVSSTFINFTDNTLYWTLTGDALPGDPPSDVPLPASLAFFLPGLLAFGILGTARRRPRV